MEKQRKFRTGDGCTFYLLENGAVADDPVLENADLVCSSLEEFIDSVEGDYVEITDGEPTKKTWPGDDPVMQDFAKWGENS